MFSQFFSRDKSISDDVQQLIKEALNSYRSESFPNGILPLVSAFTVETNKQGILVTVSLPFPCRGELAELAEQLSASLEQSVMINVDIDVKAVRSHSIANVKNIVAVASGKGGVGKSTTTVNLAAALVAEGANVGILDADIYGPSIPLMIGAGDEKPGSTDGKTMLPIVANDIAAMSIGFLVPDSDAAVWRGPMASTAFSQLLNETAWPELDYLLIDMPPGTGDIQLTLSQKVPVAGAVIVTTPQDIALADAQKGIAMFDKVKVPVIGVVENMSYHLCENCGHHSHVFGQDGGKDIADMNSVALLGQLPLDVSIRTNADLGDFSYIRQANSDIGAQYRKIARNLVSNVYHHLDARSPTNANIVIEN
ncbi:iron-sulfur cluster carrier protein ApbC [Thalassotalea euphylliae]|uniref:iron-sulfur cluster carrier protein ApbC n=1 Tax=Thalassotalea euphylliae TaxID=1655234 RepID=UPI00364473BE